ncbi:MAG: hypothetical protein BWY28_02682 [bacterium ADurb.Bin236]|nr:MAG: hypothetical protein BWY28_02682 [bacterium ADurb.Bin236]HOY63218.1 hypothetical protein [bacterium]HPN95792.1 hypothetical protein [bacterium]
MGFLSKLFSKEITDVPMYRYILAAGVGTIVGLAFFGLMNLCFMVYGSFSGGK